VTAYRSQQLELADPPRVAPPDLSGQGFEVAASGRTSLDGLMADVFVYRGPEGERVFLYLSRSPFPVARGATTQTGRAHGWVATDDRVAMVCSDEPVSYLLLGRNAARLLQLEAALEVVLA
jgi:hypothetical protein